MPITDMDRVAIPAWCAEYLTPEELASLYEAFAAHREAAIAEDRQSRTFSPDELAQAEQRGREAERAEIVAWLRKCTNDPLLASYYEGGLIAVKLDEHADAIER